MLGIHPSKDGTILILLMDDDHLVNAIKFKLRKLLMLRKQSTSKMDRHTTILFGMRQLDEEDVALKTRQEIQDLSPYLAAMFYRGIVDNELTEMLHQIVPDPRGGNEICLPLQDNEDF